MKPVEFHPEAFAELEAAADYYERQVPGLARDLRKEIENAVKRIQSTPSRWSPYRKETRRILVRRFPYLVIYRELADKIVIVAVAHGSRRPGYWHDRI